MDGLLARLVPDVYARKLLTGSRRSTRVSRLRSKSARCSRFLAVQEPHIVGKEFPSRKPKKWEPPSRLRAVVTPIPDPVPTTEKLEKRATGSQESVSSGSTERL